MILGLHYYFHYLLLFLAAQYSPDLVVQQYSGICYLEADERTRYANLAKLIDATLKKRTKLQINGDLENFRNVISIID